jgi:beta-glucuronidase
MKHLLSILVFFWFAISLHAQQQSNTQPLLQNAFNRSKTLLDGQWHFIIDPYETGYRDHRNWVPFDEKDNWKESAAPYWMNLPRTDKTQRIEYDFPNSQTIEVPGDFNHQKPELTYYEGTVWYYREFNFKKNADKIVYIYFGAVNYRADVYVNGVKLGFHEGGFDPFNFDATNLLKDGKNFIIVRADNRREKDRVPGMTTDWWNYGGITRSVELIELPKNFIRNYHLQIDVKNQDAVRGYVQLSTPAVAKGTVAIAEAGILVPFITDATGKAAIEFPSKKIKRWYPERAKLYDVVISTGSDAVKDRIGFRTIEAKGKNIYLNGKNIFLRGICMHEENPLIPGRATSKAEAEMMLGWAKELSVNMIRLAHYPHNENLPRLADEKGFLLWEEVPVYWGIDYNNASTYNQAASQLKTMVSRDINRASVIVWSVANETPRDDPKRLEFLIKMKNEVLALDENRFVSAALDRTEDKEKYLVTISDPFAKQSNIISVNEYIGWYGSLPGRIAKMKWDLTEHDKPLFISEFGSGAKYNMPGDSLVRWSEDYQDWMYRETFKMLDAIPNFRGTTPWILVDFRSPRRNLAHIKDGWNRKGLISDKGQKKKAFFTLKNYYDAKAKQYAYTIDN